MRATFQVLVIVTALFGLGLGAAFGGGVVYGRRSTPAPTATPVVAAAAPGGGAGGQGAGAAGQGTGGGGAGAPTTGVVEQVEGETVTIRTQAGGTVAVKLGAETQVRQLAPAASTDIRPGLTVSVQGQPDVDGKVAARTVQITGMGGQPGGGAGGAAGGGSPGGAPGGGQGSRPQGTPDGATPSGTRPAGGRITPTATPGR